MDANWPAALTEGTLMLDQEAAGRKASLPHRHLVCEMTEYVKRQSETFAETARMC
jgi:hypothetical protein